MSDSFEVDVAETPADPKGKYPFLNDLDVDIDVRRRLSQNLDGIVTGNDEVYTSPITKEHDPKIILAEWDKIFEANSNLMNSTLIELEMNNRSKFGPRSIAKPWTERIDSVKEYFGKDNCTIPIKYLHPKRPKQYGNLRPLKPDKAMKFLKNNTNSGLPFYTRKSKVKERTLVKFDDLLKRNDPCVLFTRTQEGGKTRNVWGYPIAKTLKEMMYYRPLLDYQKKLNWRAALIGPDYVDRQVTKLIELAEANDLVIVSIDLSAFDASAKKTLQKSAFYYISSKFQKQCTDVIEALCDSFNTIGLVTPSGILNSSHGVPSGSTFTNEVDSIIQFLVAMSSGVVDEDRMQIQGDDGLFVIRRSDLEELYDSYDKSGLKINREKSYISNDYCVYLQSLYHRDYKKNGLIGGIYPTYRALNRIIYQERWSDFEDFGLTGKDYYSIRTISILENCKYHPLFSELVKLIKKYDKYSLEYSRRSVEQYKDLLLNGSGTGGLLENQYGDNVKGINSFETVKLLRRG